jgi:hypothetical protein
MIPTTILWRPVGPKELALIEESDWRRFPPRLPEQPIFYPVCNEEYAIEIAERWNAKEGARCLQRCDRRPHRGDAPIRKIIMSA